MGDRKRRFGEVGQGDDIADLQEVGEHAHGQQGGFVQPHAAGIPFSSNGRKSMFATEDEFAAFIATLDKPLTIQLDGTITKDLAPYYPISKVA